jgi:glutathione S-transferase
MRYIDAKYADKGPRFIPTDPKKNALFEQAASIEQSNFDPYASKAAAAVVFKRYPSSIYTRSCISSSYRAQGQEPDWTAHSAYIASLDKELDGYEALLSKQRYLAGDVCFE